MGPGGGPILALAWAGAVAAPLLVLIAWRRGWAKGWAAKVVLLLSGGAYLLGVWTFLIEPKTLVVRGVVVESAAWTGPPLRIGVISDTHVAGPHTDAARVRRVVARMNRERPDTVLLLGDYVGGHVPAAQRAEPERAEILRGVAAFRGLAAPQGVVGVIGNHDTWYEGAAIATAMRRAGVRVLVNEAVRQPRLAGAYWVAGLGDLEAKEGASVHRALSAVAPGEPVVVITHWPDPFVGVPPTVALTVAGHTHCGQVNLPVFGRLVHASAASERWGCGLYSEGGRKLFVTGGVGTSILPVRFRAPPEIVVITLRAPGAGAA